MSLPSVCPSVQSLKAQAQDLEEHGSVQQAGCYLIRGRVHRLHKCIRSISCVTFCSPWSSLSSQRSLPFHFWWPQNVGPGQRQAHWAEVRRECEIWGLFSMIYKYMSMFIAPWFFQKGGILQSLNEPLCSSFVLFFVSDTSSNSSVSSMSMWLLNFSCKMTCFVTGCRKEPGKQAWTLCCRQRSCCPALTTGAGDSEACSGAPGCVPEALMG